MFALPPIHNHAKLACKIADEQARTGQIKIDVLQCQQSRLTSKPLDYHEALARCGKTLLPHLAFAILNVQEKELVSRHLRGN